MTVDRITRYGIVNSYLVEEPEGLTVIDTMLPRSTTKILAAAEARGRPIVRILLTHAHGDHIGSLDELYEALPDAEAIISVRDARLLAKDMSLDPGEPEDKLRGDYRGAETRPDREIRPGDRVGSLEAVASPGHTPGHLAFLDTRDGTLYCGDAYATLGGVATPAKLNRASRSSTWRPGTARPRSSARALRALDPKRLAPGHGKVIEDPGPAMDRAIERAAG